MKDTITKSIIVIFLTAILTASTVLMIGPQIMLIVPAAIGVGIVCALRRSFLSLACFGYPFTFGIISAVVGSGEKDGYTQTTAFAVSVGIGLVGVVLIATGLWKALAARNKSCS